MKTLRIVIIGQSLFGAEVYKLLKSSGYVIAGVFTIPDKNGRADPLGIPIKFANLSKILFPGKFPAEISTKDDVPCFKISRWRMKNQVPIFITSFLMELNGFLTNFQVIPEVFEQYKSLNAELNVLPFCTQFIPMEVITYPKHQSIIYHPSLLPRHRGASAINWYFSSFFIHT